MKKDVQKTKKVPTLDDVVVPGKAVSDLSELPPLLNEEQLKALEQQLEKLLQARLQPIFDQAMQQVITEIKTHLSEKLSEIIAKG
jgi:hypothetical protein